MLTNRLTSLLTAAFVWIVIGYGSGQQHPEASEGAYVRYMGRLKGLVHSVNFDDQGRQRVSAFSIDSGSEIASACGEGKLVSAKVESAGVVDGNAVLRIPAGEMVYATKSAIEPFLKMKAEGGLTLVGANEAQQNRSTAEIDMTGQCVTVTSLAGVGGGTAGFYVVVDLNRNRLDVASGIGLGGRFRFKRQ